MKERYTILEARSIPDLIRNVNDFIDREGEAWQPVGGIAIHDGDSKSISYKQVLYWS